MLSRTQRTPLAEWWWTVDRMLIFFIGALIVIGVMLSLAASPPVARTLRMANEFAFVQKHFIFLGLAIPLMLGVSMLSDVWLRRVALGVFLVGLVGVAATLVVGAEVKGSTRWLDLGPVNIQPSEVLKPGFFVVTAFLLAEAGKNPELRLTLISVALYGLVALLLVLQPDIGQTMLITAVWGAMLFIGGLPLAWAIGAGLAGIGGLAGAYFFVPHVTGRIDRFLDPSTGDTHQTDRAIDSFLAGGWFGRGPGEGIVKDHLPDSHTDYVFAVAAEEFGIILCLAIALIFALLVLRGLMHALNEEDPFRRLALAGLVLSLGAQAGINMGVNLDLLPAKGMTLPFISYGGSSLLSVSLTAGMLLGLSRRRARRSRFRVESPGLARARLA
ncbi:MAG: cell division protein FtsW [Hyphomicrobiaceae bacterium]|nr:cell division protein FtsW [Hyphomicrobiaceae bacterium]